ncbi:putative RNA helicase, partial [Podochytrium sp. JEL0797]
AFAPIRSGRSALVVAHTGSGKTLGFVAPLLQKTAEFEFQPSTHPTQPAAESRTAHPLSPRVLLLAPTIDLARQTLRTAAAFGAGGVVLPPPVGVSTRLLEHPFLAAATPAGLAAYASGGQKAQKALRQGLARLLERTETIVVDEADRVMGDYAMRAIVNEAASVTKKSLKKNIQWIFVAATLPPIPLSRPNDKKGKNEHSPRANILKIAPDIELCEANDSVAPIPPPNLQHSFIKVFDESRVEDEIVDKESQLDLELQAKFHLLTEALNLTIQDQSTPTAINQWLIFCNEKDTVDFLLNHLSLWMKVAKIDASRLQLAGLHKDTQEDIKSTTIARFAKGKNLSGSNAADPTFQILIATDLVARGLDFPFVSKVFIFDFPHTLSTYLHRAGRTARKGGLGDGEVVSFVGAADAKIASSVQDSIARSNKL